MDDSLERRLKRESFKCARDGRHRGKGKTKEGYIAFYCTLYQPSNIKEPYTCRLLSEEKVEIVKGSDGWTRVVEFYRCDRRKKKR